MKSVQVAARLAVGLVALGALAACAPKHERGVQAIENFALYGNVVKVHVDTCHGNPVADVAETDIDVTITVTSTPGIPAGACVDEVSVTLAAPLDGRTVIDGATGKTPVRWAP
jgi:hypothetical protein